MRDFSSWSLNLGRWRGVYLRIHASYLVFAVFAVYLATREPADELVSYSVLALAVLLVSVLVHEVAHCLAAFRLGGGAEQIVIGPIGGLAQPHVAHEPQPELLVAIAGPAANLVLLLFTIPLLVAGSESLLALLNPLQFKSLVEGSPGVVLLKLVFWVNWLLVLVNLLPAFPLDGGRVLRSILWPAFDYRTAVLVVARGAMITSVGMCGIAWLMRDAFPSSPVPAELPLVLFAIFLFFSAKQEIARLEDQDLEEELFSYDFSQGYTSLERHFEHPRASALGRLRAWLENRRESRLARQRHVEQDEERQVDEILARLHSTGMKGLSAKERALLERVSARYRNQRS